MFIEIIKSLFGKKENLGYEKSPINTLLDLTKYAECMFEEDKTVKNKKSKEMLSVITIIEKNYRDIKDDDLFYNIAIAYRNYTAWFIRGNKKKYFLKNAIKNLRKAISLSPENIDARYELSRLLINEKSVRNLEEGIEIAEKMKSEGKMPLPLNSVLARAKRQFFGVEITDIFDLCSFSDDPSPAVFREERIKFRILIRKLKKERNVDELKNILNQYYQLAVMFTLFFGDSDSSSSFGGNARMNAQEMIPKICKEIQYTYSENGIILNCNYISSNDWKTFVKVFGKNTFSFDVENCSFFN